MKIRAIWDWSPLKNENTQPQVYFLGFYEKRSFKISVSAIWFYCKKSFSRRPISENLIYNDQRVRQNCWCLQLVGSLTYFPQETRFWLFFLLGIVKRLSHFHISCTLTHFSTIFHFYTPWKRQKTKGFLTLSGGIEMEHWTKMG